MNWHSAPALGVRRLRTSPRTLLARLRASSRLAVFLLVAFALRFGAATVCMQSDFAELGIGHGDANSLVAKYSPAGDRGTATDPAALAGADACQRCSCLSAAMLPADTGARISVPPQWHVAVRVTGMSSSASPRPELRPPIIV
jgi:hypothetical protein